MQLNSQKIQNIKRGKCAAKNNGAGGNSILSKKYNGLGKENLVQKEETIDLHLYKCVFSCTLESA